MNLSRRSKDVSNHQIIKNLVVLSDSKNIEDKKIKLFGVVTNIVLSNVLIKRNNDFKEFTLDFFNIIFNDYVYNSRTLILARCLRLIDTYEPNQIDLLIEKLLIVFNVKPPMSKNTNSNNLEVLISWRKVINNE